MDSLTAVWTATGDALGQLTQHESVQGVKQAVGELGVQVGRGIAGLKGRVAAVYYPPIAGARELPEISSEQGLKLAKICHPNIYQALANLRLEQEVSPAAIEEVLTLWNTDNQFVTTQSFLFDGTEGKLPDRGTSRFAFIPVVVKGAFVNHIVVFAFDSQTKELEFFDSKGYGIKDYETSRLLCSNYSTLERVEMAMVTEYGKDNGIEGRTKECGIAHQTDRHSCGIYVLDYIRRRLDNQTPVQIHEAPIPHVSERRVEFYHQLHDLATRPIAD